MPSGRDEAARRRLMEIIDEAEGVKKVYPAFDLDREFDNPMFRRLMAAGVPVISAYELMHRDEINGLLAEKAVRQAEKRISAAISSGEKRPKENGSAGKSAAVMSFDPKGLSGEERRSIRERVKRGERIVF